MYTGYEGQNFETSKNPLQGIANIDVSMLKHALRLIQHSLINRRIE